jgi:hypothetical protein
MRGSSGRDSMPSGNTAEQHHIDNDGPALTHPHLQTHPLLIQLDETASYSSADDQNSQNSLSYRTISHKNPSTHPTNASHSVAGFLFSRGLTSFSYIMAPHIGRLRRQSLQLQMPNTNGYQHITLFIIFHRDPPCTERLRPIACLIVDHNA